jgi:HPt (histidine-containing phosphotransfer) domain-containing protein
MNDFVSKPIMKAVLRNALTKWLHTDEVACPTANGQAFSFGITEKVTDVFDRSNVLLRLEGDDKLAQIVFAEFLEDIPRQIQALKDLVKNGDASGSARQAHAIRGACASVGGEVLRKVATEMENAADAGDLVSVKIRMADMEAQFLLLRDAIKRECDAGA